MGRLPKQRACTSLKCQGHQSQGKTEKSPRKKEREELGPGRPQGESNPDPLLWETELRQPANAELWPSPRWPPRPAAAVREDVPIKEPHGTRRTRRQASTCALRWACRHARGCDTHRLGVLQGLVQLRAGHDGVPFAGPPQHSFKRFHFPLVNEARHKAARQHGQAAVSGKQRTLTKHIQDVRKTFISDKMAGMRKAPNRQVSKMLDKEFLKHPFQCRAEPRIREILRNQSEGTLCRLAASYWP